MKSTSKLYAAGGGLLVAALLGFSPALADDGTTAAIDQAMSPIEITATDSAPDETYSVEGVELDSQTPQADSAASAGENEVEPAQNTAATEDTAETTDETIAQPEASAPAVESDTPASESGVTESPVTEAVEGTAAEPVAKEDTDTVTAQETAAEGTIPEGITATEETEPVAEPEADATAEGTSDAAAETNDKASVEAAAEPSTAKAAVKAVAPVKYVTANYYAAPGGDSPEITKIDVDAPAPLITAAITTASITATPTDSNGESMVVWFELPEPAGPPLVPGQATPLLGAAVSEENVSEEATINANVVPVTAVGTSAVKSAESAPAAAPAAGVADTAISAETGNLSRGLARTGSIAQYAAILSAAALILGVGMLFAATATSRRSARPESE